MEASGRIMTNYSGAIVGITLLAGVAAACGATVPAGTVTVVDERTIEFPAVITAAAFDAGDMPGYHLLVWEGGGAADHALLRSLVSDVQVIDALEQIGAQPGDALRTDSWAERTDAEAEAPTRRIEGPPVQLEFVLPNGDVLRLDDFLLDPGGRGFDMRFGGHRDNIPEWHSGCVVCLYSCPGSKVGNASYTVRDFVTAATHFEVRRERLPADGTEITVRLQVGEEAAP
jgi:hypothetical protein